MRNSILVEDFVSRRLHPARSGFQGHAISLLFGHAVPTARAVLVTPSSSRDRRVLIDLLAVLSDGAIGFSFCPCRGSEPPRFLRDPDVLMCQSPSRWRPGIRRNDHFPQPNAP